MSPSAQQTAVPVLSPSWRRARIFAVDTRWLSFHGNYQDEVGNDFHTRIQGTRIKRHMGKAAIKMYDKHGIMLGIETTANDVSFFKHYCEAVHGGGTRTCKFPPMKKSIYSLKTLLKLLHDTNRRYIEFLVAIDDPTNGIKQLDRVSKTILNHVYKHQSFVYTDVKLTRAKDPAMS